MLGGTSARILTLAAALAAGLAALQPEGAKAFESLEFQVIDAPETLETALRNASVLLQSQLDGTTDPQDLFAAARAEYARLVAVLYSQAYYSPVINVTVDGREAASIAPLDAPPRVERVLVTVRPGSQFVFSQARIAPLAPKTELPKAFALGETAGTGVIQDAAKAAVDGWRAVGHAKAQVGDQSLTVDHARETLAADLKMAPGPRLRFGQFIVEGQERMRDERIRAIAGFPEGKVFDPALLARSADRLRRTGVFRSVSVVESENVGPGDTLDITTTLVEDKLRRYGLGAEISTSGGLDATGFWMHRNLFGGAERLRFDAAIENVGAQDSGVDYRVGVTLERPATFTPDTLLGIGLTAARIDDEDQTIDLATIGVTATQFLSDRLTVRAGLEYRHEDVTDLTGDYTFDNLALPLGATLDERNSKFDPTRGYFVAAELTPYVGFDETESGARLTLDARGYRGFGEDRPLVLAGRIQVGSILGAELTRTPRDYLFYSGGAGTVRGQPYQSLGVYAVAPDQLTGGSQFLGASAEIRAMITDTIGVVGFYDFGTVGVNEFFDDPLGGSQSGAGIGLRYATGLGPIRLDIAGPVSGDTGDGVQIYVGIGQAF